ncbi:hypothetical protein Tco_1033849 [Tanacetum coccineum]
MSINQSISKGLPTWLSLLEENRLNRVVGLWGKRLRMICLFAGYELTGMVNSGGIRGKGLRAQLVDTDTESDPEEAPSEVEELQPVGSRVPLMSEEFEASEPSGTRTVSPHSLVSSDSTTPLSPDNPLTYVSPTPTPTRFSFHRRTACMVVRTQPTLSPGMSARIAKATALSPSSFCKRCRSSYETPSPSSSPTLLVRKRYGGTSELILDIDIEGEELGEEDTKENEEDETTSKPLGLGYKAARRRTLESTEEIAPSTYEVGQSSRVYTDIPTYVSLVAPVQTLLSPEWSLGSLPVSPSSLLELHEGILHDHTQHLDVLPPTLFEGYNRDLRELYTRPRVVRDEIFSQRYSFRSLEREQERATMTFSDIWRRVLALELAEEKREQLELTNHVARMERRHES